MALAAQDNEIHPQPTPLQPSFSCDIDYLKPFNGFTRDLRDRGGRREAGVSILSSLSGGQRHFRASCA